MEQDNSLNVYILTYNRANFLKETIESVLQQSYRNFQLYILDNHSMDDTGSLVGSFKDERLHYIRHKKNIGAANNMRYALSHCKADYCVIFHDDDIMLPSFLEREKAILDDRSDISLVSCNAKKMDKDGNEIGFFFPHEREDRCYKGKELIEGYIKNGTVLVFPSIMYRMDFLKEHKVEPLDEPGGGADVIFYNDILRTGGIAYELSDPLMKYRTHGGQDSRCSAKDLELRLFQYMWHKEYYASILKRMKEEQKNVFRRNGKTLCIEMLQDRAEPKEALIYLNKYGICWNHSRLYFGFLKMIILICIRMPYLAKKIYKGYNFCKKRRLIDHEDCIYG